MLSPHVQSAKGTENFWVIAVVSNPARYRSRYDLYRDFERRVIAAGANVLTVELALRSRHHEVTCGVREGRRIHVQLKSDHEVWIKESLINAGIRHLPPSWEYVMWADADVEFCRTDWVEETVHQLQHFPIVQCFRDAVDLGPEGQFVAKHSGFAWAALCGRPCGQPGGYGYLGHPGYAWAARRECVDDLGGLFDLGILGSSDHHMAWALVGKVLEAAPKGLSAGYKRALLEWQERARIHVRGQVGYVPGTIHHHWHGKKRDRKYADRWAILLDHGFDPDHDIKRDWQGLHLLTDYGRRMEGDIRKYLMGRNEDSIDVD